MPKAQTDKDKTIWQTLKKPENKTKTKKNKNKTNSHKTKNRNNQEEDSKTKNQKTKTTKNKITILHSLTQEEEKLRFNTLDKRFVKDNLFECSIHLVE